MLFNKSNMKIVEWEYNEQLIGKDDKATPIRFAGLLRNKETNKPTGVWFQWSYTLKRGTDISLHCSGKDSYTIHDIPGFTIQDLALTIHQSFENFTRVFLDRLDLIDLEVANAVYPIGEEDLVFLLNELKK
jgi:hypothetical protein